jgi:hypothetical protein
MGEKKPLWEIEQKDGWWAIEGDEAPGSARAREFGFIMEIAAEEARRLGVDGDEVIEVRRGGGRWTIEVRHVIEDYGRGEAS